MQYSVGQLLDGRYYLTRSIGSGSFGEVWVAIDKATDLEVAVKIYLSMDPQGLSDFKKEFQVSFDLNHTNLLHANYLGTTAEDNRAYLVMPLCPDGSASKYIGKADEFVLWKFIKDVAAGLAYLHEQHPPLIHQDIKPDNILISKNGDFLITDFGISKQLRSTLKKSVGHLNSAGSVSYMGPERFSKQSMPIKASDIWSLGATVYELAVGDLPFCGMGGSMQKKGAHILGFALGDQLGSFGFGIGDGDIHGLIHFVAGQGGFLVAVGGVLFRHLVPLGDHPGVNRVQVALGQVELLDLHILHPDAVGTGQGIHIGGNGFVDLIALGTVLHVDDVGLGQGAHDGLQLIVGQRVQTLLGNASGAQGLVEQLGIGNGPEDVAVHGHVLLVGGQHLGRGDVVELGGLGEVLHAVDEGQLEVEACFAGGVNDLREAHGAGVFIFLHGEDAVDADEGDQQKDDDNNTAFFHSY